MRDTAERRIGLKAKQLTPSVARLLDDRGLVTFIRHSSLPERRGMNGDRMKGPDFSASIPGFHNVTETDRGVGLAMAP